jgi:hypothetical protein
MCEGCIHIGRFHLLHEEDNGNAEGVGERDRNADPGKRLRNKVSSPHQ